MWEMALERKLGGYWRESSSNWIREIVCMRAWVVVVEAWIR